MFTLENTPLLYAEPPFFDESLIGYLIRLSELHKLKSISPILKLLTGKKNKIPSNKDIFHFSSLVGCEPNKISQLFGFEWSNSQYRRIWKLGNEWITKPYFISSRNLSVCPECLNDKPYFRSIWELVFYQACPIHKCLLIQNCPNCNKKITWEKSAITKCICGANLTYADTLSPNKYQLHLSSLILSRISNTSITIPSDVLSNTFSNKLLHLSLDGLFKTIWLLGEVLVNNQTHTYKTNHIPKKVSLASEITKNAYQALLNWPHNFFQTLIIFQKLSVKKSNTSKIQDVFGPVHRYFTEDMSSKEFIFLTIAYEHHIRKIWSSANKTIPRSISSQLEFDFRGTHEYK